MRWIVALLMVVPGVLVAQGFSDNSQSVKSDIESEDVPPPVVVSPTQGLAGKGNSVAVSATVSPFVVKGVAITISDSTGFARDAAMQKAARKALPGVLQALPMDAEKAQKTAKSVGDPMLFVASYTIVKETLIPTYSLLIDLTFNEAMLRANFGGEVVKTVPVASQPVGKQGENSAADGAFAATDASATAPVAQKGPLELRRYVVRLTNGDPVSQDKVYSKLRKLPDTRVSYRLVTSAGVELDVRTALEEAALDRVLEGSGAQVVRALEPVAASAVDAFSGGVVVQGSADGKPVLRPMMPSGGAYSPDLDPAMDSGNGGQGDAH